MTEQDMNKKTRVRRPVKDRLSEKLNKLSAKAEIFITDLKRYNIDGQAVMDAYATIDREIQSIPDEVKRARQAGVIITKFGDGDYVAIKEGNREEYDGLLSDEGILRMRVLSINNKQVFCETPELQKIRLPKAHLYLTERGADVAEEEETPAVCSFSGEVIAPRGMESDIPF